MKSDKERIDELLTLCIKQGKLLDQYAELVKIKDKQFEKLMAIAKSMVEDFKQYVK